MNVGVQRDGQLNDDANGDPADPIREEIGLPRNESAVLVETVLAEFRWALAAEIKPASFGGFHQRCEDLRRAERDARSLANSLTRQLDTCRFKLKAAVAEAKEARRPIHSALKIGSRATKALERRVKFQDDEVADLRLSLSSSHEHREWTAAGHQDEINWLKKDIDRGSSQIVKVSRKGDRAAESLRKQFDRRLAAARRLVGPGRARSRGCANATTGCEWRSCGPRS